jgi:excisionase family DNA binding protein
MKAPPERDAVWLTTSDAAARARVARKTIYKAVKRGKLRAAQLSAGGDYRFKDEWVDAWLESIEVGRGER